MRSAALGLLAGVALLVGCGGTASHPAPALWLTQPYPDDSAHFDDLTLSYACQGVPSSYLIQRRQPPGDFDAGEVLDPMVQGSYQFAQATPELTDWEFRLVAVYPDGQRVPSAPVPFHRGMRPPSLGCQGIGLDCTVDAGEVHLAWAVESAVADRLRLERLVNPVSSEPGPWIELPVTFADREYVDRDVSAYKDRAYIAYRLTVGTATACGVTKSVSTVRALPLGPAGVEATVIPGGVRISFVNRSHFADAALILRQTAEGAQDPVEVAADRAPFGQQVVFDDLGLAPGAYRYDVQIAAGTPGNYWMSPAVMAYAYLPPASASGVGSGFVDVPSGEWAVRLADGRFAVAANSLVANTLALGADQVTLPWNLVHPSPGVALGADGLPHAVYQTPRLWSDGTSPSSFIHAWHDGLAWRSEEIAVRSNATLQSFDVGLDGALRAVWTPIYGAGPPEVATLTAGGWTTEVLPESLIVTFPQERVLVSGDEAGQPHLLLCCYHDDSVYGGRRAWRAGGRWSIEPVPNRSAPGDEHGYPTHFFANGESLWIVQGAAGSVPNVQAYALEARGAGGWSAALPLGDGWDVSAGRSRDGQRLIVALGAPAASTEATLFLRGPGGDATLGWMPRWAYPFAAGYGADGAPWVLDWLPTTDRAHTPALLLQP